MIKIIDHVYQVGGSGLTAAADAAVYLIVIDTDAALIDAGTGRGHDALVRNIDACLPSQARLTHLFLTHSHFDHTGGAARLREHYQCTIVAHAHEARFLETGDSRVTAAAWYHAELSPFTVDYAITGSQETFHIGHQALQALHCPGHSPGSVVYLMEIGGKRVLFGQDIHGPLHPELLSNRDDYITSLTMLLGLEADILCEGHFGVIRGRANVQAFIQSYLP